MICNQFICPFSSAPCCGARACETKCVRHFGPAPIDAVVAASWFQQWTNMVWGGDYANPNRTW